MFRHIRFFASALCSLSLYFVPTVEAQFTSLNHVWTVPGVIESSNLSTLVSCTNATTSTQTIGLEVYGATGGYVIGDSTVVAPQGSVLIATASVPNLALDLELNAGTVTKGHGRIMATTSKGILCNAMLVTSSNGVPLVNLGIIKRQAQKGD